MYVWVGGGQWKMLNSEITEQNVAISYHSGNKSYDDTNENVLL